MVRVAPVEVLFDKGASGGVNLEKHHMPFICLIDGMKQRDDVAICDTGVEVWI